jgi:hypothetical protein
VTLGAKNTFRASGKVAASLAAFFREPAAEVSRVAGIFYEVLLLELLFSEGIYFGLPAVSSPRAPMKMTAPVPPPRAGAVFQCSQAVAQPLEHRMPHLAFGGLGAIFDLRNQLWFDPHRLLRDPLAVRVGLADQEVSSGDAIQPRTAKRQSGKIGPGNIVCWSMPSATRSLTLSFHEIC